MIMMIMTMVIIMVIIIIIAKMILDMEIQFPSVENYYPLDSIKTFILIMKKIIILVCNDYDC